MSDNRDTKIRETINLALLSRTDKEAALAALDSLLADRDDEQQTWIDIAATQAERAERAERSLADVDSAWRLSEVQRLQAERALADSDEALRELHAAVFNRGPGVSPDPFPVEHPAMKRARAVLASRPPANEATEC